ncbi:MAG: peptidoglycan editing factor PgeF, partial [Methylococcales bacterium]|nr:peptidoglycan editing factor PgeF [Methylococcales bacterium]
MNKNKHWITPDWPAPANIHAATTLRTGGVSVAPYTSLNPATHVGDEAACVSENRQCIKTMLALPSDPVWLEQTHSDIVINAAQNNTLQQADASYSNVAGVVCAIMTADCLPLLICSTDGKQIAAIHAGWRGLLAGIITNTVNALATTEVLVWLGPAIGAACFEVGAEVREAFLAKSAAFAPAFTHTSDNKYLADIYQLARIELAALGIHAVYGGDFCTVT